MTTLAELLDDFALLTEWEERYSHLIALGRKLPPLREDEKSEPNLVQGCMSQVWFVADTLDAQGQLHFRADSDAHIVKGLISILLTAYSGKTPAAIAALEIEPVFRQLGLEQHLSPNRRNGFFSMVGRIKALAHQQGLPPH